MIRKIAFAMGLGLLPAAVVAQDAAAPAQDAPAQAAPADPGTTYEAARNQLGILQYCQEQGFTGAEAVEAQGKLVGLLQGGDEAVGSAAEDGPAARAVTAELVATHDATDAP